MPAFREQVEEWKLWRTASDNSHRGKSETGEIIPETPFQIEGRTVGVPRVPKRWQLARGKNAPSPSQETSVPPRETSIHSKISTLWQLKSFKTWPRGLPVFTSLYMTPFSLFFLFSANRTFLTFAARVCLRFLSKRNNGPSPPSGDTSSPEVITGYAKLQMTA
jgi:hypothetical protein